MSSNEHRAVSRRSILAAGIGSAIGVAAAALGRPTPVNATVATMQTGTDNAADATTRLVGPDVGTVLGIRRSTMSSDFESGGEVVAIGTDLLTYPALRVVSTNEDNAVAVDVSAGGADGLGLRVSGTLHGVMAEQTNEFGSGVHGTAGGAEAVGVRGIGTGLTTVGVNGSSKGSAGIAVYGYAEGTGTGGRFVSEQGTALNV